MNVGTQELRGRALEYLLSMREDGSWRFRFCGHNQPSLIGSSLAAMLGGLLGFNARLDGAERQAWAGYLNSRQRDDGLFEDSDIAMENLRPGYARDRALYHRARHAVFALRSLGLAPGKPLRFVERWTPRAKMRAWATSLDLADYWYCGNMMMDAAIFLMEHTSMDFRMAPSR